MAGTAKHKKGKKPIALLSAADKTGIVEFARELRELNYKIIGSEGTVKVLNENGIKATDVADWVGGGPILGHKVVTLSREVHAGLLAHPVDDRKEMKQLGLRYIDLVYVTLYPLQPALDDLDRTVESIQAKTDVGGPTMLHAGAKGERIVVSDQADLDSVIGWIKAGKPGEELVRRQLAVKARTIAGKHLLASAHGIQDELTAYLAANLDAKALWLP